MNYFTYIAFLIFTASFPVQAQFEECIDPMGNVNCSFYDQAIVALSAKKDEMKKRYATPSTPKNLREFEQELKDYLYIFNKLQSCPNAPKGCPSFLYKQILNTESTLIKTTDYSSFGRPCAIAKKPTVIYENILERPILFEVGANIQIKVRSQCSPTETLSFVAYKEGLLVGSNSDKVSFESQAVGRRIPLAKSQLEVRPTGKNLRLVWKSKTKESWIEVDPMTMTFTDSNFMKVDQLNSGKCQVEKMPQPESVCAKNRALLIKHKGITRPSEYDCQEYIPVIQGVSSSVTRG